MEEEIKKLNGRIEKLENKKEKRWKAILPHLIYPLVLLVIGYILNKQLDNSKKEIQRLQIAQQMVTGMYEEDHSYKRTLTSLQLAENVLGIKMYNSLDRIVQKYFQTDFENTSIEEAGALLQVVEAIGGEKFDSVVNLDTERLTEVRQFNEAKTVQEEGINELINGDVEVAITKLYESEKLSPEFNQNKQMAVYLEDKKDSMDDPEVKKQVYQTLVVKYSKKMPDNLTNKLIKEAAN